jgi:hypothetical protein
MTTYTMNRWASNEAQVCKENFCYIVDASAITSTWRAVNWDGASGSAELCDGTDYDINTGEQAISSESELSALATAWQVAYDADQAAIAAAAEEEAPDQQQVTELPE